MESPASAGQSPDSQNAEQARAFSRANEKKFICNYLPDCKAAFSRQEHLQRHIRKHTGERPFSCGCGRTFTRLDNLRQHAQTVHSGTEMAKVSDEQTAIAAERKMRPTPNSPPPRFDGGSDSDPYPRPVSKASKARIKQAKGQDTPTERSASPPDTAQDDPTQQPVVHLHHPYQSMSLMQDPIHTQVDPNSFHSINTSFDPYPATLQSFSPSNFVPVIQNHEIESSVGSQPISSLAKRRPAKHDFIYTGGHMMNSPPNASDTMPDEGEQMSEYINNGLEPNSVKDRTLSMSEKERMADGLSMLCELAVAQRD